MYTLPSRPPNLLKRVLVKSLVAPGVAETLSALTGTQTTIFMLHRFSAPELGVSGHEPAALRRTLAYFRKRRYRLIPLHDLFLKLQAGEPMKRTVAFTIDDGYFEHLSVGGRVFAEFDCPATTFVTTGFIDGQLWFWFDQLAYIFQETKRTELHAQLSGVRIPYQIDSPEARLNAWRDLSSRCKEAPDTDRLACIRELSGEAGVELPAAPPPRFAPLSWDDARAAERQGMTFGPHTVTHPVLSTTSDSQSCFEIEQSWNRLSAEVTRPVPVFCYPNGRLRDFGEREIAHLRRLGFIGAVTGEQQTDLRPEEFLKSPSAPFLVPRFGYVDSLPHVLECVAGLESVKRRLRGAAS